jgi:hypothetical protein
LPPLDLNVAPDGCEGVGPIEIRRPAPPLRPHLARLHSIISSLMSIYYNNKTENIYVWAQSWYMGETMAREAKKELGRPANRDVFRELFVIVYRPAGIQSHRYVLQLIQNAHLIINLLILIILLY